MRSIPSRILQSIRQHRARGIAIDLGIFGQEPNQLIQRVLQDGLAVGRIGGGIDGMLTSRMAAA